MDGPNKTPRSDSDESDEGIVRPVSKEMDTLSRRLHQCPSGQAGQRDALQQTSAKGDTRGDIPEGLLTLRRGPAYIAGIVDGEGTITLGRKHARDGRQLVISISISSTERQILELVRERVGAGKITGKKATSPRHAPGLTYAIWSRQALRLLQQIRPFLHSYKRGRAELVERHYVRLTPRNGKYAPAVLAARRQFEAELLAMRANRAPASPA